MKKSRQPVQLPSDFNVEEYASQRYVRRAGNKNVRTNFKYKIWKNKNLINLKLQHRISDAHSNVRSLSCREAKLQYIRNWEALPEHGLHYFIVKFR
jgi:hypothetical protein